METATVENFKEFIRLARYNSDNSRQHMASELEVFARLVESRADTLSLIDYCYWRKAIEDVLEYGQRRLYKRYETDISAR